MGDDAWLVVVFSPTRVAHPVFHEQARWEAHPTWRTTLDDGWVKVHHENRTLCGRTIHSWGWEEDPAGPARPTRAYRSTDFAIHLRLDQARSFGRPCSRCWPSPAQA